MKIIYLKSIAITFALSTLLSGCSTTASSNGNNFPPTQVLTKNISNNSDMSFKVVRLYSGKDGVSHFEDLTVNASQYYLATKISTLAATPMSSALSFQLLSFPKQFTWDWHNPPAGSRFLELVINGSETFTAGDGTSRTLKPGDIMLFDDATGLGHKALGKNGRSLIIKLPPLK